MTVEILKNKLYETSSYEQSGISTLSQFYGNLKDIGYFPETVIIQGKIVHKADLKLEIFDERKTGFFLWGKAEDGTAIYITFVNDNFFNFCLMKELVEILEKNIEKDSLTDKIFSRLKTNKLL